MNEVTRYTPVKLFGKYSRTDGLISVCEWPMLVLSSNGMREPEIRPGPLLSIWLHHRGHVPLLRLRY